MLNLKTLAGHRYRVSLEESAGLDPGQAERPWYFRLEGRRGHIYLHGSATLGAWTNSRHVARQLEATPGVAVHQRGDRELSVTFGPELLDTVAGLIKARRRRQVSEAERERLKSISGLPTLRGTSRA